MLLGFSTGVGRGRLGACGGEGFLGSAAKDARSIISCRESLTEDDTN